jgi:hypothetical protein
MSMSRMLLAASFVASLPAFTIHVHAATLSLVGSSQKVCQLTGDRDWLTGQPTAAQTNTRYGLNAVDLGFPVDSGRGPLYFLFGDARPATTLNPIPPDDALGVTTRTSPPDSQTCLDLKLVSSAPGTFAHPTVAPAILQGAFNVPTGGVFMGNKLYAFFWTNHCVFPQTPLPPMPDAPLRLPAPSAGCPESPVFNSIGHSVLARATPPDPAAFDRTHPGHQPPFPPFPSRFAGMPSGFVYVSAASPGPRPPRTPFEIRFEGAQERPAAIPVFGVPRYRASIPYLAMAPQETFGDPATWRFFAGMSAGQPTWVSRREWESGRNTGGQWTPPAGAEIYPDSVFNGLDEQCVGEHSATWNEALRTWLLLYVCEPFRVEARTAPQPWGPWSQPTVVLSLLHDPGVVCTLIMSPDPVKHPCPASLQNYFPGQNPPPGGFFYAPFVMERFTQDLTPAGAEGTRQATIYWLVSTWNPYQVVVMQSTLQIAP